MIEVFPNSAALAEAAAAGIALRLREGLQTRGRATLAGTGGRSPGPVYDRLKDAPGIDWARVIVTLSDERCVGPDDAQSNQKLLRERLMRGEAEKARLLPLWPRPEPALLARLLPFDALMLGMGEDGHIASLFPGDPGVQPHLDPSSPALLADVPAGLGTPPTARVTLTLKALLAARAIFLLIAGDAKRALIEGALPAQDLPVRPLLAQTEAPLRVFWSPN